MLINTDDRFAYEDGSPRKKSLLSSGENTDRPEAFVRYFGLPPARFRR
tara:strand:+ start:1400 stop:1543 length:144 start_codon:yes stop_codon:yes gene_type:complete